MTIEDFELLKKYDDKFMSVANGATMVKYVTVAMQKECGAVYQHLFGRVVAQGEWSCPHCAFKVIKDVAMDYVNTKHQLENKEVKKTRKNAKKCMQ